MSSQEQAVPFLSSNEMGQFVKNAFETIFYNIFVINCEFYQKIIKYKKVYV